LPSAAATKASRRAASGAQQNSGMALIVSWVVPAITRLPALSSILEIGIATSCLPRPTKPLAQTMT
jgi:hypothetical protein